MDATDAGQLVAAVERAQAALGLVTILVNNAGIPDAQRAHKMPLELIDRVIDINIRAPFVLSCEVARRLIEPASPAGSSTSPRRRPTTRRRRRGPLFGEQVGGVRITETLSVEWARFNINVNGIAPGAFESEMMDGMLQRVGDIWERFPRKRIGDPPAQLHPALPGGPGLRRGDRHGGAGG